MYQKALATLLRVVGPNHTDVARTHFNLSGVYNDLGDLKKTLHHLEQAVAVAERTWPASDSNLLLFRAIYASQLVEAGDLDVAADFSERATRDARPFPDQVSSPFFAICALIQTLATHASTGLAQDRAAVLDAYSSLAALDKGPISQSLADSLHRVMIEREIVSP